LSTRGNVIASHGSDGEDEEALAAPKPNGLGGILGSDRTLRRRILGRHGSPGIPTVMIETFNVMQDRITRARLAGDPPDVPITCGTEAAEKSIDAVTEAVTVLSQNV
jgi:NTE family protein